MKRLTVILSASLLLGACGAKDAETVQAAPAPSQDNPWSDLVRKADQRHAESLLYEAWLDCQDYHDQISGCDVIEQNWKRLLAGKQSNARATADRKVAVEAARLSGHQ